MKQKRILTVNDVSCFGKCSTTVVLPILSVLGFECVPLPTAILSTHTGGFEGYSFLDMTSEMKKITAHWQKENIKFDCIFTGYLGNAEQIEIIADLMENNPNVPIIVDPVMADSGKLYAGFDENYAEKMTELCKKADVITPNYTEACLIAKTAYSENPTDEEIEKCFENFAKKGIRAAAITGIKTSDGKMKTEYRDLISKKKYSATHPFVKATLHGSGDVFSSVLCGELLSGKNTEDALIAADKFTYECIKITETSGEYGLNFEPLLKTLCKY